MGSARGEFRSPWRTHPPPVREDLGDTRHVHSCICQQGSPQPSILGNCMFRKAAQRDPPFSSPRATAVPQTHRMLALGQG